MVSLQVVREDVAATEKSLIISIPIHSSHSTNQKKKCHRNMFYFTVRWHLIIDKREKLVTWSIRTMAMAMAMAFALKKCQTLSIKLKRSKYYSLIKNVLTIFLANCSWAFFHSLEVSHRFWSFATAGCKQIRQFEYNNVTANFLTGEIRQVADFLHNALSSSLLSSSVVSKKIRCFRMLWLRKRR